VLPWGSPLLVITRSQATLISSLPSSLPLSIGMSSTAVYATQSSAGEYSHPHDDADMSRPASPTLVNVTRPANRPSITLKIPGGGSDILNSVVVDSAGRSLYSISSTSKRTTLVSCADNVKVATVDWDRPSPLLVFRRKKVKCRKWLPRVAPETEYTPIPVTANYDAEHDHASSRVFTHGETQFSWMEQSTSGYVSIGSENDACLWDRIDRRAIAHPC